MGTPSAAEEKIPVRIRSEDRDRLLRRARLMSVDKDRTVSMGEVLTDILDRLEKAEARDE
jgi:hypothetical protein